MPRNKITDADKQRIVDAYSRRENYVEAARILGVCQSSAYAIVQRFQKYGVISRPRGGAHNKRMDDEMIQTLTSIVEERPEYTLTQLNAELRHRLPTKPNVCDNVIANALHGQLITLKMTRDVPAQRNTDVVKNARNDMANWLLHNTVIEKIYVDESGFRLWLKRTMGRSPRGERAFRFVNARGSQHVSVIFAVSSERGLIHHEFKEGGFRSNDFNNFLEDCSRRSAERPIVFIFDNAPSHSAAHESNLSPGHTFRFQPPYSPFLNICEGCFSVWKAAFKREMAEIRHQLLTEDHQRRLASMMQIAEQTITSVTPDKALNFFHKSLSYLPSCLAHDDILM